MTYRFIHTIYRQSTYSHLNAPARVRTKTKEGRRITAACMKSMLFLLFLSSRVQYLTRLLPQYKII